LEPQGFLQKITKAYSMVDRISLTYIAKSNIVKPNATRLSITYRRYIEIIDIAYGYLTDWRLGLTVNTRSHTHADFDARESALHRDLGGLSRYCKIDIATVDTTDSSEKGFYFTRCTYFGPAGGLALPASRHI